MTSRSRSPPPKKEESQQLAGVKDAAPPPFDVPDTASTTPKAYLPCPLPIPKDATTVSGQTLYNSVINGTCFVFDARPAAEYAVIHCTGAINVTLSDLHAALTVDTKGSAHLARTNIKKKYGVDMESSSRDVLLVGVASEPLLEDVLEGLRDINRNKAVARLGVSLRVWHPRYAACCAGTAASMHIDHIKKLPNEVIDGFMFLGSKHALKQKILDGLKIKAVLTMTQDPADKLVEKFDASPYLVAHFPIDDAPIALIEQHFAGAIAFIEGCRRVGTRILVHCYAGISRSATIVIAYMMHINMFPTVKAALTCLQHMRPVVNPNPGFLRKLKRHYDVSKKIGCHKTDGLGVDHEDGAKDTAAHHRMCFVCGKPGCVQMCSRCGMCMCGESCWKARWHGFLHSEVCVPRLHWRAKKLLRRMGEEIEGE